MIHRPVFVGIDISKARVDVYLHPSGKQLSAANQPKALVELARQLVVLAPEAVAVEASGGYERQAIQLLHAEGLSVYVLAPARVQAFARAIGQNAKTDALDAMMIARCLEASHERLVAYAPDPARDRLSALLAHRRRLVAEHACLNGQLDTIAEPLVRRMIRARIRSIDLALVVLDKAVRAFLDTHTQLERRCARLSCQTGVGPVLSRTLVADMPELGRVSAKTAAALLGVAPHARQSGNSQRPGRCQGGRKHLRDILYMATLSAIRSRDPALTPFYDRLRAKGKTFKVAIIAAMRKMITILNAIARDDPAFACA
jgi:transposase